MTVTIDLTRGYTAIVDDEDADLAAYRWSSQEGGYAIHNKDAKGGRLMHRIILERKLGRSLEKGEMCDHVDGVRGNNTRANLRIATRSQNGINRDRSRFSKSPYKGIRRSSRYRWGASVGGKSLGTFTDPLEAHRTFCIASLKYHGEWANFGSNSPYIGWALADLERGYQQPIQLPLPLLEAA